MNRKTLEIAIESHLLMVLLLLPPLTSNYKWLSAQAHLKVRSAITFSMALSSYYMQEMNVISNNYSNPFEFCFDTSTTCEDLSPFFSESLGYPAPYQKDDTFCNIPPLYEQDEVFPAISHCEQDLMSYWRNWDGEYQSCFANNGYTDGNSFSNPLEKTGIQFQSGEEEYGDNCFLDYDTLERQQLSVDDRCWSDCEYWFGYANEEYSCYEKQSNNYETALCEGIFGYWPCLMQKQQLPCPQD